MNRYKEGDKVRVREDLEVGRCYGTGEYDILEPMLKLKGKSVTIHRVHGNMTYSIAADDCYMWTHEMFEPVEPEQPLSIRELTRRVKKLECARNLQSDILQRIVELEIFKDMQVEYDKATTLRLNRIEFKQMSDTETVESEPRKQKGVFIC